MVTADTTIEAVARRDRMGVLVSLISLTLLAWLYLVWDAGRMMDMPGMPMAAPWALSHFVMMFLMWAIMMVGMMIPSASPMILLYVQLARKHAERGHLLPRVWIFTSGYLAIWTAFSLLATVMQMLLEQAALMSPMMVATSTTLSSLLLIVAGIYQWLPWKNACLKRCRAPLQFFMLNWRSGRLGAFCMGLEHGAFCVGCCWGLMLLLFVGGVMNLLWIALIAGFVLLEKVLPAGPLTGRIAGLGLVIIGFWQLLALS
jgi:predicted metal-binding membrane protein